MTTRVLIWAILPALSLCAGCSGTGLVPTTGKATLKGKGIKGAVVVFHPKDATITSQRPSGVTDENGAFSLTTGPENGAPPGDYVVTITWPEEPKAAKGKGFSTENTQEEAPDRLERKYADPKTSKLTATVNSGATTVPTFELE